MGLDRHEAYVDCAAFQSSGATSQFSRRPRWVQCDDLSFFENFELTGYLVGTPHYNSASGELSFPDLDYAIETRNLLVKVADWFNHEELRNELRKKLVVNLSDSIVKGKKALHNAVNRKIGPAQLSGSFNEVRLVGIRVDPAANSFRADMIMQGGVRVTIP